MSRTRAFPPIVAQTLTDSCWAAVLESWSRIDSRIPRQNQADLIAQWGEGPTGGITPADKIPAISAALGLRWSVSTGLDLATYLEQQIPLSHVFCAYTRVELPEDDDGNRPSHSVLIYRLSDRGNIDYMDPDGGHDAWHPVSWFAARGPMVLMQIL